jgi:hypothetical protein
LRARVTDNIFDFGFADFAHTQPSFARFFADFKIVSLRLQFFVLFLV